MPQPRNGEVATIRAAIYCRVSSKQQEDNYSLGTQENGCRTYCDERGYMVADQRVFIDVHSGADLYERPALTKLRAAMRRHEFDVVVVYALDRLSRAQVHMAILFEEADTAGAVIECVTEQIDRTATGMLLLNVRAFVAEVEREKIRERVTRGMLARAKSGKPVHGSSEPYGYCWNADQSNYELHPQQAGIVRRIFEAIASGKTQKRVCAELDSDGIPPPSPTNVRRTHSGWAATTLNHILKNPMYYGQAYAWRWTTSTRHETNEFTGARKKIRVRTARPVEEHIPLAAVPAIVSEPVWLAVQQQMKRNREVERCKVRYPETFLLRGGFVVCGYCNWRGITAWSHGVPYYRCSKSKYHGATACHHHVVSSVALDKAAWDFAAALLRQPDIIAREVGKLRGAENPHAETLATLNKRLAKLNRQAENLSAAIAETENAPARTRLLAQLEALGDEEKRLVAERRDLSKMQANWETVQQRLQNVEAWCHAVTRKLDTLNYDEKRLALYALGVTAKIYGTEHAPRFELEARPLDQAGYGKSEYSGVEVEQLRKLRGCPAGRISGYC